MSKNRLPELLLEISKEKGIDELEVYSQSANSLGIKVFKGQIDSYSIDSSAGLSCRGKYRGEMGSSYTEKTDEDPNILIDSLIENAEIINACEDISLFKGSDEYKDVCNYNEELEQVDNKEKIDFLKNLEAYALGYDEKIDAVNYCFYGDESGEFSLVNSKGLNLSSRSNLAISYVSVIAKDGEDIQTGFEYIASRDFNDFDYKKLGENAAKKALSMLGAKSVPSDSYKVILKNEAFADLLAAYASVFSAENVQKGLSLLKDKIGEDIAAPSITIIDDPFLENGYASRSFDAEGVASRVNNIIVDGNLKTYLYDLKTAKKDGVEPTGNASRSSYKGTTGISPSNMYLVPGSVSYEELISTMDSGIVITDLQGLHAGVNTISGDFSLSAEGYLVEGGNIVRPVNQITIAGNFLELLKDIDVIGSDLRFNLPSGSGAIGCPSALFNSVSVSGE